MNKELIEKLKRNWTAWAGLTEEEQEVIFEAGEALYFDDENWHKISMSRKVPVPLHKIFRLAPDYQPEPEYEDVEIVMHGKCLGGNENLRLGIWNANSPRFWIPLYEIPAMPNFRGFFNGTVKVPQTCIAEDVANGKKVIARFVK